MKPPTPYATPTWAWQFVNYAYLLGAKATGEPLVLGARSVSPSTLRQRMFGGRFYVVNVLNDTECAGLRDFANETIISPSGLSGIHIVPTTDFQTAYYTALRQGNKYLDLLAAADLFALDPNSERSMTLQVTLSPPQSEALNKFFNIRPALKGSMIGETLVVLRKV